MMVGVTEGLLPFKLGAEGASGADANPNAPMSEGIVQRLQEERRLMYVGITRAQRSLAVSWTKKRRRPRDDRGAAQPLHRGDGAGKAHGKEEPVRSSRPCARSSPRRRSIPLPRPQRPGAMRPRCVVLVPSRRSPARSPATALDHRRCCLPQGSRGDAGAPAGHVARRIRRLDPGRHVAAGKTPGTQRKRARTCQPRGDRAEVAATWTRANSRSKNRTTAPTSAPRGWATS